MIREIMVRRHISIPASLDDDMRSFIAENTRRWGKGEFSDLVIDAVRSYIDPGTHTQIHTSKMHRNNKCDLLYSGIKDYLTSNYHFETFTQQIPLKLIDEAISETMDVHDRRSIRDWRKRLETGGYIKRLKDEHYNDMSFFKFLKEGNDIKNVPKKNTAGDIITE